MIVLKFGGTSVSSKKNINTISNIVKQELTKKPIVVVSALSTITNLLVSLTVIPVDEHSSIITKIKNIHINLINDLFPRNSIIYQKTIKFIQTNLHNLEKIAQIKPENLKIKKWKDEILAHGEIMSSYIITNFLILSNIKAKQVSATKCIITDKNFGSANFIRGLTKEHTKQTLIPLIKKNIVPVVTGFIGSTISKETTTLGRGGSDYSASIIGYALKGSEIQIWTDVDGIYTADPRLIKNAKLLPSLSYQEAAELSRFGAKVLHPRTILPAVKLNIPVKVLNTFNQKCGGTTITQNPDKQGQIIKAITSKPTAPIINIYSVDMLLNQGFLKKIFSVFAKYNISIDLVSASEVNVSVTLDNTENLEFAIKELEKFANVSYTPQYGSVSLIGEKIMDIPNLMPKVFTLLENNSIKVHMLSYSAANINISFVVPTINVNKTVEILHHNLIL